MGELRQLSLGCGKEIAIGKRRPSLLGSRPNRVLREEPPDWDWRALVEQDERQRSAAVRSRLRAANSMTA